MKTKTTKRFYSVDQARQAEAVENFKKSVLTAACSIAKRKGWSWTFEGSMIWVNTGDRTVGCTSREDFYNFCTGK